MLYRLIDRDNWQGFLDYLSHFVSGKQVEVEVASPQIGDQVIEEWARLDGISYDPKEDVLFIHTEEVDHPIYSPRELILAEDGASIKSISIKDEQGFLDIIQFREPLLLAS